MLRNFFTSLFFVVILIGGLYCDAVNPDLNREGFEKLVQAVYTERCAKRTNDMDEKVSQCYVNLSNKQVKDLTNTCMNWQMGTQNPSAFKDYLTNSCSNYTLVTKTVGCIFQEQTKMTKNLSEDELIAGIKEALVCTQEIPAV